MTVLVTGGADIVGGYPHQSLVADGSGAVVERDAPEAERTRADEPTTSVRERAGKATESDGANREWAEPLVAA